MKILVSGKNGQLGHELQNLSSGYKNFEFIFFDKNELDITDESSLSNAFQKFNPHFFINCAAYTAVDKAETEQEKAFLINAEAVGNIARHCNRFHTTCIHISTDYVFDGITSVPYKEDGTTNPVNYYGYTKWMGEKLAINNNPHTIIIRTSWVYSHYGNNFVKTMLRLMQERNEINVVYDQLGSPTYAKDLAEAIMAIINKYSLGNESEKFPGIYHFSNEGIISWFDFAKAIQTIRHLNCEVNPIPSTSYPTPAKRPHYSGLDKSKFIATFELSLKNWEESLKECLSLL